jgi:hypothetical protein
MYAIAFAFVGGVQAAGRLQRKHDVLHHSLPRKELIELLKNHHAIGTGLHDRTALETDLTLGRPHVAAN